MIEWKRNFDLPSEAFIVVLQTLWSRMFKFKNTERNFFIYSSYSVHYSVTRLTAHSLVNQKKIERICQMKSSIIEHALSLALASSAAPKTRSPKKTHQSSRNSFMWLIALYADRHYGFIISYMCNKFLYGHYLLKSINQNRIFLSLA